MAEDGKVVYKIEGDASQAMQAVDQFESYAKAAAQRVEQAETQASQRVEAAVKKSADAAEEAAKDSSKGVEEAAKEAMTNTEASVVSSAEKIAKAIGAAFTTKKIIEFGKYAVGVASDLSEVQNVVDTTFGEEGAQRINEWAMSAAESFGESELQAKQFTSTIGAMFKSMGVGQKDLEEMSIGIAGLAGDMASFYNLDVSEAFEKLRAGISGETEPLKQLGINMNVVNLEAYAMAQGITTAYEEMSQAEQATLRYQYIMQATADAQGDFSKTSDSFANQTRILQLELQTLAAEIGQDLMPIALELVGAARDAIQWGTEHKEVLEALAIAVVSLTSAYAAYKASISAADVIEEVISNTKGVATAADSAKTSVGNLTSAFSVMPIEAKLAAAGIAAITAAVIALQLAQEEALNKQLEYMDSLTTYADLQANGDLVMTGGTWNEETKMWEGVTTKPTASAQKAIAAGTYQNAERTALGSAEGRTFWTNNFGSLYAIAGTGAQTSAGTSRHQSGEDFVMSDWTPAFLDYGERVLTRQENMAYTAMGGVEGMTRAVESTGATAQKTDVDVKLGFTVSPREMAHAITPYVIDEMKRTKG